jgi:hypothetical protein
MHWMLGIERSDRSTDWRWSTSKTGRTTLRLAAIIMSD